MAEDHIAEMGELGFEPKEFSFKVHLSALCSPAYLANPPACILCYLSVRLCSLCFPTQNPNLFLPGPPILFVFPFVTVV